MCIHGDQDFKGQERMHRGPEKKWAEQLTLFPEDTQKFLASRGQLEKLMLIGKKW